MCTGSKASEHVYWRQGFRKWSMCTASKASDHRACMLGARLPSVFSRSRAFERVNGSEAGVMTRTLTNILILVFTSRHAWFLNSFKYVDM